MGLQSTGRAGVSMAENGKRGLPDCMIYVATTSCQEGLSSVDMSLGACDRRVGLLVMLIDLCSPAGKQDHYRMCHKPENNGLCGSCD